MDRDWHERHLLAAQIHELVDNGEFADTYAGLVIDPENNRVLVYRVPGHAAAFDEAVRSFSDARVHLMDARHAHAELEDLKGKIGQDVRIRWSTLGVKGDGSAVVVGVRTEHERRRVTDLLAGQPVVIRLSNPVLL